MAWIHLMFLILLVLATNALIWFVLAVYQQHQLMRYVKKNRNESWQKITSVFGKPGGRNAFKGLSYIDGLQDNDDPYIMTMKMKFRRSFKWLVGTFVSAFVVALLAAWIGFKING